MTSARDPETGAAGSSQPAHAQRAERAFHGASFLIDRSMLWLGLLVFLASLLMSPDPDMLTVFGVDVPVLCGYRLFTGMDCLGCGLTRSFTYMTHLQPMEAFAMHKAGPVAWLCVVGQVPYRAWKLGAAARMRRPRRSPEVTAPDGR